MDFANRWVLRKNVREMDMVDYLSSLGYEPVRISRDDYWYLSPLRDEKQPSFKVNRRINGWYDHGIGKGGNLVDFAILYNNCTVGEFYRHLQDHERFQRPVFLPASKKDLRENKIQIVRADSLVSSALIRYLRQRRIPLDIAREFCTEVRYALRGKNYYGIGFKNDSGGYEIRNLYFKAGSSPKDITTIRNGSDEAIVFEGFIDFLSFKTTHRELSGKEHDFVILNTLAFFEKARAFMEGHKRIRLYLDNDDAGRRCSRHAVSLSHMYRDESGLYRNHKDFNDWLRNFGRPNKKIPGQGKPPAGAGRS
jgi:hypothetical protein